jgi:long-chain acyl-CoA synthetase
MGEENKTGYPSIDKPWMKYYDERIIDTPLPRRSIYDNIYINNHEHLEDIALRYFGNRISYGELFDGIGQAEKIFCSLGVKAQEVVSFISIFTPEMIYAFYALNKIGAVSSMLDPRATADELARKISDAESKILVVLDACMEQLDEIVTHTELEHIVVLSTGKSMGMPAKHLYTAKTLFSKRKYNSKTEKLIRKWEDLQNMSVNEQPGNQSSLDVSENQAVICYTGGTTGESKGVVLTNNNVNAIVEQFRKATNGFERQQTWMTPSVPFIAYALACSLHMPLSFGMECCIELYDNHKMAMTIINSKYNHVLATPVLYEELLQEYGDKKIDLSFLIMPITGADKLSEKQYNDINTSLQEHNCSWKICNGYGMTEVGSAACVSVSNECNKAASVGIPFPDTTVTAFDVTTGKECRIGESGEICIQGPGVMKGYFKNKEKTDEVIHIHEDGKRWMHTGDIGHVDEDGCIFIEGRIKRMIIKYDGFKVFPNVVEEKILTCSYIGNCVCVGIEDKAHTTGQLPVVVIVPSDKSIDENVIKDEVRKICKQELSEYAQPTEYYFYDKLPLTHAGKVDYRVLEKQISNQRITTNEHSF